MERSKRKAMAITAVLLLLALCVITCYAMRANAKFIVSNVSHSMARVARFGVTIDTGDMGESGGFSREYQTDDESVVGTISNSVVSAGAVLAPGTKGDMFSVTIKGTPEVAVRVAFEAEFAVTNWTAFEGTEQNCFYCPVIIRIGDKTVKGIDYTSEAEFEKAVNDAIEGYSKNYAPGQNLQGIETPVVTWEWPFETGENADDKEKNDKKDTSLGNRKAENRQEPIISLQIKTTVTQID